MKKTLYSTTALAAAGMFLLTGTDAAAQQAEKVKLGLGGFMKSFVAYAEQEDAFETAEDAHYGTINMVNDSEVYFTGNTTLDNGIRADVIVQLEADQNQANNGNVLDETYLKLTGGFGDLRLGSTKHAGLLLMKNAPSHGIIHNYNPDITKLIVNPSSAGISSTDVGVSDAMKIVYYTPKFSGFQAGVSYEPSSSNSDNPIITGGANSGTTSEQSTGSAAITYDGSFNDATVGATASMWQVDGTGTSDRSGWSLGARVGFGGFLVGAAYGEVDDEQADTTTTTSIADYDAYNIGVSYSTGPWSVGVTWAVQENTVTQATGDAQSEVLTLGASYNVGPGIKVGGNIVTADFDDETTTATENNEGWALVGGIQVSF